MQPKIFDLPIILTEQYSKWLGPTIPEIAENLPDYDPISKIHFNCCDEKTFNDRFKSSFEVIDQFNSETIFINENFSIIKIKREQ